MKSGAHYFYSYCHSVVRDISCESRHFLRKVTNCGLQQKRPSKKVEIAYQLYILYPAQDSKRSCKRDNHSKTAEKAYR